MTKNRSSSLARWGVLNFVFLLGFLMVPGPTIPAAQSAGVSWEKIASEAGSRLVEFSLTWNPGGGVGAAQLLQLLEEIRSGLPNGGGVSGEYDPVAGLHLEAEGLVLDVSPGSLSSPTTLSIRRAGASDLPSLLPGDLDLAGGVFEPHGQVFDVSAHVSVSLATQTLLPVLPVVYFDPNLARWVGTGDNAQIGSGGMEAGFDLGHFSLAGVPDAVPIPDPGDPIGSFVVLSNNGNFQSETISSATAALLFSDFGDTFNISLSHQEINNQGHIETKALGLDSILVTRLDNYVIGVVGGGASLYNDGQFNEPAIGVMIMSVTQGEVSLSVYAATVERVIQGTMSGHV